MTVKGSEWRVKIVKKTTKTPLIVKEKDEVAEKPKYTDLRQVMDYKRPLTIFFSGVEYESYLEILYNLGIRNFLMSYEYLKGKGLAQLKKYPDMHLFIDSGAYTYMHDPKYEDYTIEQWEEQIVKYLNWAERHKSQIFAIADLDLQYIVGCEQVYEWRKKYFEPFMLRTGIPVCFMYHDEGMEQWEYMCKRYPYTGLSLAIDKKENGEAELKDMFRIAEKYNTLTQGMASTNTQLLTQYPFYTVDSTTWNVGLKYGEISVWNGTKMSRIKKQEFETKAFPLIQQYDRTFDLDLIREEDKTEMIRVNAYAFIMAEKYVRERLKARMYWFKAKAQKVDVNNLPDDFFPTPEWFDGDKADIGDYCTKMNINPDFEGAYQTLYDMTVFMNWENPTYREMRDEYEENDCKLITELHDFFVNRIVSDVETKVADLAKFFKECLAGENDKLLQLGTNFDRTIKERESYIEEEDTEVVELTPEQVRDKIAYLLPTPADEVDEVALEKVDKDIFSHLEIKPQFDEKGKFIKGQTIARKPKNVYSEKYPKLACDTCLNAAKCPEYKAGYACAYNKMFKRFDTRNMKDLMEGIQSIVSFNMERMQRSMINEVLNGVIDPTTTQLMDTNIKYMNMLKQMYENSSAEVLRQSRVIRNDGTMEETTQVTNPQSGGILERIFGGMSEPPKPKKEEPPIEADFKEVKE